MRTLCHVWTSTYRSTGILCLFVHFSIWIFKFNNNCDPFFLSRSGYLFFFSPPRDPRQSGGVGVGEEMRLEIDTQVRKWWAVLCFQYEERYHGHQISYTFCLFFSFFFKTQLFVHQTLVSIVGQWNNFLNLWYRSLNLIFPKMEGEGGGKRWRRNLHLGGKGCS